MRPANRARTCVFKGLKHGEGDFPKVNDGWAFCGKPRTAYRNDGTPIPAPEGMVHMVYADGDGYVFDWDWVSRESGEPGYPSIGTCDLGMPFSSVETPS